MDILSIIKDYRALDLDQVIDHQKFSEYALTHHSTSIEGSTLTEVDTRLLLDEGITPQGKPLEHSLMVKDHYAALQFILEAAKKKLPVTIEFIQQVGAMVLKSTGKTYNTVLGNVDAAKGEFRKGNVSAGGSYFINYDKVIPYTTKFVEGLRDAMTPTLDEATALRLSFIAQFDLVSIHPFYDGNGRTSRLMMNYIQAFYNLPLAIVHKEDRAEYFTALTESRKQEDTGIFYNFMEKQYRKQLTAEINEYKKISSKQQVKPRRGRRLSIFY